MLNSELIRSQINLILSEINLESDSQINRHKIISHAYYIDREIKMSTWFDYYVTQYFYPATAETQSGQNETFIDGSKDVTIQEIPATQEVPIAVDTLQVGETVQVSQNDQDMIMIDKVAGDETVESVIPMAPPLLSPVKFAPKSPVWAQVSPCVSPIAQPSRFTQAMLGQLPEEVENDGCGYQSGPMMEMSLPAKAETPTDANLPQSRKRKWRGRGQQVKVALKKLDMQWVKKNESVLAIGARNTGKSMIIRDYLKKHTDFKATVMVNPTESICQEYSEVIDPMCVHDEVSPNLLKNMLHVCKSARNDPDFSAVMILDNVEIQKLCKDKDFSYMTMNGRNLRLGVLMTQQFPTRLETQGQKKTPEAFPPSVRANLDWVFLGRETNMSTLRKLYDLYASQFFTTFEMFKAVHKRCTKDFGFLVIHQASRSDKLEDCVFWYRADATN